MYAIKGGCLNTLNAWCCVLKGNQQTDTWGVNATTTTLSLLHGPCTSECRLAVLVHMSCNNLIKIRRILDWSGGCRIKIRRMPDWSGQCQIEIGIRIPVCEKSSPRLVGSLHPTLIGDDAVLCAGTTGKKSDLLWELCLVYTRQLFLMLLHLFCCKPL